MKHKILLSVFFSCTLFFAYAQPGSLDSAFGNNGLVRETFIPANNLSEAVLKVFPAPNGGYLALLHNVDDFAIGFTRFTASGLVDKTFGNNGFVSIKGVRPVKTAAQADGKILVAGQTSEPNIPNSTAYHIYRYTTEGILDKTFSEDGEVINDFPIFSIAASADNKIVVSGGSAFALARFNNDGSPDLSFGNGGKQLDNLTGNDVRAGVIAIQNDGKIIYAGEYFVPLNCEKCSPDDGDFVSIIIRYNADGSLEKSFAGNGFLSPNLQFLTGGNLDVTNLLALQPDGKIIIAGSISINSDNNIQLLRLNTDGSEDVGFVRKLIDFGTSDFPTDLVLQPDGKIIMTVWAGGDYYEQVDNFTVLRFNADGNFDNTFNADGVLTTDFGFKDFANSAIVQNDGKIVVAGGTFGPLNSDFALARYNNDGSPDNSFSSDGKVSGFFPTGRGGVNSMALQHDGKIIQAGYVDAGTRVFKFFASRYYANGSIDSTFGVNGKQSVDFGGGDEFGLYLAIQPDDKIVIAGFTIIGHNDVFNVGIDAFALARFTKDGKPDSSFSSDGKQTVVFDNYFSADPSSLSIQKDGKIIITGIVTDNAFNSDLAIARFTNDGSLDKTFDGDGKRTYTNFHGTSTGGVQDDGKILVATSAMIANNLTNVLARFDNQGVPDKSFSGDGTISTDMAINNIIIQPDGKILTIGSSIYRYNADGTPDMTFGETGKVVINVGPEAIEAVLAAKLQTDGKIVISGGNFNEAGSGDIAIIRINANGSVDSSFGSGGRVIKDFGGDEFGRSIDIYENKLYVAGEKILSAFKLEDRDNGFPKVDITTPSNNAAFISPVKTLDIEATASDDDGISKVEFYNGTLLLNTQTKVPYSFTWTNLTTGSYTITAVATDKTGHSTTSAPVHIIVSPNQAPVISFVKPTQNKIYAYPSTINIEVAATDDGKITKVEFYNGSTLLHTEYQAPYTYPWKNVTVGSYVLTAKAFDNWGASATAEVNFSVDYNKAPVVELTSPIANDFFTSPATINLAANASDVDGKVTRVEFFNGPALIATEYKEPYTYQWQNVAEGLYTITAVATDNFGVKSTSGSVEVKVIQAGSLYVTLTSPGDNTVTLEGTRVQFNAIAGVPEGDAIANVKFYENGNYLKTIFTAPYSWYTQSLIPGKHIITAKVTSNSGLSAFSSPVTIYINAKQTIALNNLQKQTSVDNYAIILSPNPAKNILNVSTGGLQFDKEFTLTILSSNGTIVGQQKGNGVNKTIPLNVSLLRSGSYTLQIKSGNKTLTQQFIKL